MGRMKPEHNAAIHIAAIVCSTWLLQYVLQQRDSSAAGMTIQRSKSPHAKFGLVGGLYADFFFGVPTPASIIGTGKRGTCSAVKHALMLSVTMALALDVLREHIRGVITEQRKPIFTAMVTGIVKQILRLKDMLLLNEVHHFSD